MLRKERTAYFNGTLEVRVMLAPPGYVEIIILISFSIVPMDSLKNSNFFLNIFKT